MKEKIKIARQNKDLKIKDLAMLMGLDPALVSKWESGTRKPTKEQVIKLAEVLELDLNTLLVEWMSEMILYEIGDDDLALEALKVAENKIKYNNLKTNLKLPKILNKKLDLLDKYKTQLNQFRHLNSEKIIQALELEYTYDSNKIEGNTLTLNETNLVINEGITISGKSMREHLEAINHQDAIEFIKELIYKKSNFRESDILQLHYLILKGIDNENAGRYRKVQVMIKGSRHMPPQPYLVAKQMEDLMIWYELNAKKIHPVLLAAEFSERFVTIHPFIDGNGRTSRLLMNLILLKNGYVIANIKGDNKSRLNYYNALESVQVDQDKNAFYEFIINSATDSIKRYIDILTK